MKPNIGSKVEYIDQHSAQHSPSMFGRRTSHGLAGSGFTAVEIEQHVQQISSKLVGRTDNPTYLVTMYKGIGDAVLVGLSFIDQIIQENPQASGKIDVLCNSVQAELFEYDPRVNRIILTNDSLFSPSEMTMWLNGITLDTKTAALTRFLRNRHYEAVFAFMFAPGFYLRLRSTIVYPNLFQLGKDFWSLSHHVDVPMSKMTRRMVSNYFGSKRTLINISDDIPLYLSSEQVKNAKVVARKLKERSKVPPE